MDYRECANDEPSAWSHAIASRCHRPASIQFTYTLDENEWDGAVQFGTFNRIRMCPVLEVSISGFIRVEVMQSESALCLIRN